MTFLLSFFHGVFQSFVCDVATAGMQTPSFKADVVDICKNKKQCQFLFGFGKYSFIVIKYNTM